MRYGIIAAGEGSRLAEEGIAVPKPLVKIQDETLIDRLIRIFIHHGAEEVDVICNGLTPLVADHLRELERRGLDGKEVPLRWIQQTTPSSTLLVTLWARGPSCLLLWTQSSANVTSPIM